LDTNEKRRKGKEITREHEIYDDDDDDVDHSSHPIDYKKK
jgi:hypothetical protein